MKNDVGIKALEAMERFITTFNTRNAKDWSESLQYPHVRPSARRDPRIFQTAEEYEAGVNFDRPIRMGWDHSEWDSKEVLHASNNKVHAAGQYTRYTAEGEKIMTNHVTYIVTRINDNWGIQSRFGIDLFDESTSNIDEVESLVSKVIEDSVSATNARDCENLAVLLNYPCLEVDTGVVNTWKSPQEFCKQHHWLPTSVDVGWHHCGLDLVKVIQKSTIAANVAVEMSHYNAENRIIATSQAIYFLTFKEQHWGIQARSTIEKIL
ncbi:MAG: hypothetical protein ISS66_01535 [Desulfobacteraceae bacterium]|nr:hypothetical protein [Desulfobacteraceae bacterium]